MENIGNIATIYQIGIGGLKVIKNEEGNVVAVENDQGMVEERFRPITDLKIDDGTKSYKIVWIPNDTIIHTQSSPGCTWYFFQGKWWRICT